MRTPLSSCLKVTALLLGIAISVTAEQPTISGGVVLSKLRAPLVPPRSAAIPGPSYGSGPAQVTLGACLATTRTNLDGFVPAEITNCERVVPFGEGLLSIAFPLALPSGALVTAITLNYWDSDTTVDPSLGFLRTSPDGGLEPLATLIAPVFDGGDNAVTWQLVPPVQIDNTYAHQLMAVLKQTSDTQFSGITSFGVSYLLQVSLAPASATFADVPIDHPFFQFIEALVNSGITVGCGFGNFCPDDPLTRGQMAVFLSKALGLHFPN